ncbi:hypothetical protein pb186bvf_011672 [Paramecium bursaria]
MAYQQRINIVAKITKGASLQEIKKSFRELSKTLHPDKIGEQGTIKYRQIIQAYEVLSDADLQQAYNDYLDNPNRSEFQHHYQYYQRVYHPQSNPYIVITLSIITLSIIQYTARIGMYKNAISRVQETSHFKKIINERYQDAIDDGKDVEKEDIIRDTLKEVNITGAWSKPKFSDIWIIAITLFFYNIAYTIYFNILWDQKYQNAKFEDIPSKHVEYKTKLLLKINEDNWKMMDNKEELIERGLWKKENMIQYEKEMKEKHEEYLLQKK